MNDKLRKTINDHSRSLEKGNIEVREFCGKVKQRTVSETTSVPHIYDEGCKK